MKQIINLKIDGGHYTAKACMVWCFDHRFSGKLLKEFIVDGGYLKRDPIVIAGGAKDIATPEELTDRDYVLRQIAKSIRLHHPPHVFLMTHANCGAYGKTFENPEEERAFYESELIRAKDITEKYLKEKNLAEGLEVVPLYADFSGLYQL
ncbi:hypothetical protein HYW53_02820 [Candidatus Giovannonibacteria bacterium]|nr:hypothetical protein [Candidatus Giovannonibacteria bacterium]